MLCNIGGTREILLCMNLANRVTLQNWDFSTRGDIKQSKVGHCNGNLFNHYYNILEPMLR
jgi:hypothetical protein